MIHRWRPLAQRTSMALALLVGLVVTAVLPMLLPSAASAAASLLAPLVGEADQPRPPWQFVGLPKQTKPRTDYRIAAVDGRRALRIDTAAGYGNLVHPLPAGTQGHRLAWRWRLDQPNASADLRQKASDDGAAKLCLLFDLPMAQVPFIERQLLRLARVLSGEPLPGATVCYVWDNRLPPGTVLDNAYTRRVRYLVLQGPEAPLRQWVSEQRDVVADFGRLFGDEATAPPPLLAVAVSADADNTQGRSLAWLDALTLD